MSMLSIAAFYRHTAWVLCSLCTILLYCAPAAAANDERSRWEGVWLHEGYSFGDSLYENVIIEAVTEEGFIYYFQERTVPYGPNEWNGERRHARFTGTRQALDEEKNRRFELSQGPDNPYAWSVTVNGSHTSPDPDYRQRYRIQPRFYPTSYDCLRSSTAIEHRLCKHELLAEADRRLGTRYAALIRALPEEAGEQLRADQRRWLSFRNTECQSERRSDTSCLARAYADRLAELEDTTSGPSTGYNAAYLSSVVMNGIAPEDDLPTRLVFESRGFDLGEAQSVRPGEHLIVLEGSDSRAEVVWPVDVHFNIHTLFVVQGDGRVWTAKHSASHRPLMEEELWRLGRGAVEWSVHGDPGTSESDWPPEVREWVERRKLE